MNHETGAMCPPFTNHIAILGWFPYVAHHWFCRMETVQKRKKENGKWLNHRNLTWMMHFSCGNRWEIAFSQKFDGFLPRPKLMPIKPTGHSQAHTDSHTSSPSREWWKLKARASIKGIWHFSINFLAFSQSNFSCLRLLDAKCKMASLWGYIERRRRRRMKD